MPWFKAKSYPNQHPIVMLKFLIEGRALIFGQMSAYTGAYGGLLFLKMSNSKWSVEYFNFRILRVFPQYLKLCIFDGILSGCVVQKNSYEVLRLVCSLICIQGGRSLLTGSNCSWNFRPLFCVLTATPYILLVQSNKQLVCLSTKNTHQSSTALKETTFLLHFE